MPVQTQIKPDKIERVPEIVRELLTEEILAAAAELEGRIKSRIREIGAITTGQMAGSYAVSQVPNQSNEIMVRVGTPVEHGDYLEFGTRPHFPPLEPIKRWVENKLNVIAVGVTFEGGKAKPTGKATRQFTRIRNLDARDRAITKIARAVQFSIAQTGMRPRHFVRDALQSLGLEYQLRDFIYNVDTLETLAKRSDFWAKVKERLA
jgi:hypothetical protein